MKKSLIKVKKRNNRGLYIVTLAAITFITASFIFLKSVYTVPILMYHNIDQHYKESKLSISPESFERQMRFLRNKNYNIVSLDALVELIKSKRPIPYKTAAVTFDDGYENNYTAAYPILKKYNIPAAVFAVVNKVGERGYMDWDQLGEMSRNNIEIGSHTLSECYLPDIKDEKRLKREIFESRRRIKTRIPRAGSFFGYCSGGFNEKIRQMVIDAGYKGACATNPGKNYPNDDIYVLKRLRISRTSDNLFVFWLQTSGFYTWIKEHRDED